MSIAIVPGSFDPMTKGHVDIIRRAAEKYDTVYVAVMINGEKKYMFSMEERKEIAERSCRGFTNVKVICDSGMLYELYSRLGADAVVKGVRDAKDLAYERDMAEFNRRMNSNFNTEFLFAKDELAGISSTRVREKLIAGNDVSDMMSCDIEDIFFDKKFV